MNEPSIDEMGTLLSLAELEYQTAKNNLDRLKKTIVELLGAKREGVEHHTGDIYKLSITGKVSRRIDREAMLDNQAIQAVIKLTPTLDVKAFKALAVSNPDAYREASRAVIATDGTPTIKAEEII